MDASHGTNENYFQLITVTVVDEFEVVPAARLISNREDQALLVESFNAIKKRMGDIIAKYIMTDNAQQYFTVWQRPLVRSREIALCLTYSFIFFSQNISWDRIFSNNVCNQSEESFCCACTFSDCRSKAFTAEGVCQKRKDSWRLWVVCFDAVIIGSALSTLCPIF